MLSNLAICMANEEREEIGEKSLHGIIEGGKGNWSQPLLPQTSKTKSGKKSHHRRNLLHLKQSDNKPSCLNQYVFKPSWRDKVYSTKPPKVSGVSINVRSILRARSALVICWDFFPLDFYHACSSPKSVYIKMLWYELFYSQRRMSLSISVLDIYIRLSYISYLGD